MGRNIDKDVERRLYAESMGRCMNPECRENLFDKNGDIIEKAHIDPYCDTADNTFDNLIVLCPNCHTKFDKSHKFTAEEVLNWKQIRRNEVEKIFAKKFSSFEDLRTIISPILEENKAIYENYYLREDKSLWTKFEVKVLHNNRKLSILLSENRNLIQHYKDENYSNLSCINAFLSHVEEFELTRNDDEKNRKILFPVEINSMFGVSPIKDYLLPSVESVETLITTLQSEKRFINIFLGNDNPYIELLENGKPVKLYLNDAPRLRQYYFDNNCFRKTAVRLESLNFALKYINSQKVKYQIIHFNNLKEILIGNIKIIFIYEYCLSKVALMRLAPETNSIVVNLHNWNGYYCISQEAYDASKKMGVTLLTMNDFYEYIKKL